MCRKSVCVNMCLSVHACLCTCMHMYVFAVQTVNSWIRLQSTCTHSILSVFEEVRLYLPNAFTHTRKPTPQVDLH